MGETTNRKTKSGTIRDLSDLANIHENFIVRGCRPPPPIRTEEDEEMRLLFGDHYQSGGSDADDMAYNPPDLDGIQQMLKMVNNLEDDDRTRGTETTGDVILISKLNPDVREFVPKSQGDCQKLSDKTMDKVDAKSTSEPQKPLNTTNLSNEDIKILSDSLKFKISKASGSECFKSKREKNVAIATLLRLHAKVDDKDNDSSINKLVLIPPDYYINKNLVNKKEENSDVNEDTRVNSNDNFNTTSNNTLQGTTESESTSDYDADKEIKNSIEKVNNWLNPKPPEKKTLPVFGQITFKKKDSGILSQVESKASVTTKKTRRDSCEFVPSTNALKQKEIYMQRIREREKAESVKKQIVSFENLEDVLKERDEKIRKELNSSLNSNIS